MSEVGVSMGVCGVRTRRARRGKNQTGVRIRTCGVRVRREANDTSGVNIGTRGVSERTCGVTVGADEVSVGLDGVRNEYRDSWGDRRGQ